jgi:hypothetical protein
MKAKRKQQSPHKQQKQKERKYSHHHLCNCTWDDCEELHKFIQENAPDGHVWKGPIFNLQKEKNDSPSAYLINCALQNLKVEDKGKNRYCFHRHHWSVSLLQANASKSPRHRRLSTYILSNEATQLDKSDNKERAISDIKYRLDNVKKRSHYVNADGVRIYPEIKPDDKLMSVQAPTTNAVEVRFYKDTLAPGSRKQRTQPASPPHFLSSLDIQTALHPLHSPQASENDFSPSRSENALSPPRLLLDRPSSPPCVTYFPRVLYGPPRPTALPIQVLPTKEELNAILKKAYSQIIAAEGSTDLVGNEDAVRQSLFVLTGWYKSNEPIQISTGCFLHPCIGGAECCTGYAIRKMLKTNDIPFCEPCKPGKKVVLQKRRRKAVSQDTRVQASSSTPFSILSPTSKGVRFANVSRKLRKTKLQLARAKLKLLDDKSVIVIDPGDGVRGILTAAAKHCKDRGVEFKKEIIKAIIQVDDDPNSTILKKKEEYADFIFEEINNIQKKLQGKDSHVRFNATIVRTAMASWLRSPASYRQLKECSLQVLPSERTLQKMAAEIKPDEGICPKLYGWFHDLFVGDDLKDQIMGHLLFDEMKLEKDIYWNCSNNKCAGFARSGPGDTIDLKESIRELLLDIVEEEEQDGDDQQDTEKRSTIEMRDHEAAIYVNQFRLRTTRKLTDKAFKHNAEFFYNTGSLDADELLRQFMHVITCYEMIGVWILGNCMDAGGGNAGLCTLLRGGIDVHPHDTWLDESLVTFPNLVVGKQ